MVGDGVGAEDGPGTRVGDTVGAAVGGATPLLQTIKPDPTDP